MAFKIISLSIPDVRIIEPDVYGDERGFFKETFKVSDFESLGISSCYKQDSLSYSQKNVLRGLHFQLPPHDQIKIVSVYEGVIFDVAVDLRKSSCTYGEWVGEILSRDNHRSLLIPAGFAHGFVTLSDQALVHYKMSKEYHLESERGIAYDDPNIDIDWKVDNPILSSKDLRNPRLKDVDLPF